MIDWNGNGKKNDPFDIAIDMMILDEMEEEEKANPTKYEKPSKPQGDGCYVFIGWVIIIACAIYLLT